MKRFLLSLLAISVGFVALADNPKTPPTGTPIPIDPEPLKPQPLSLNADIEANYQDGMLTIAFNADLGDAIITVANLTTGEMWMESTNGMGITTIELLDSEGYFIITIETDNGDYTGSFII